MAAPKELDAPEALICTMVLVAAADGGMTDREIGVMAGLVQTLPVFEDFSAGELGVATEAAVALLNEEDGLRLAARLIRTALSPRLRETAYALACEVVAADDVAGQESLEECFQFRTQAEGLALPLEDAARIPGHFQGVTDIRKPQKPKRLSAILFAAGEKRNPAGIGHPTVFLS